MQYRDGIQRLPGRRRPIGGRRPSAGRAGGPGFTLIELLVVIAIIGVLAGLLFPALAKAKRMAYKADTLSLMRQLGLAAQMYSDDHRDVLPLEKPVGGADSPSWADVRAPAAAGVWYNVLPALMHLPTAADFSTSNQPGFYSRGSVFYLPGARYPTTNLLAAPVFAIAFNSKLQSGDTACSRTCIAVPSVTALFIESGLPPEADLALPGQKGANFTGQPHAFASRFVGRYSGLGCVLFADGHAEAIQNTLVVDTASGKAFFPQSQGAVIWTPDPAANPN